MKHSKSGLFLMELIISILFFALASTVCIQLFVRSHLVSRETVDKNHAVIHAQNLAECFIDSQGDMEALQLYMPEGILSNTQGNIFSLYFDSKWKNCDPLTAKYQASIAYDVSEKGSGSISAKITVLEIEGGHQIYSLSLEHHIQERRGG